MRKLIVQLLMLSMTVQSSSSPLPSEYLSKPYLGSILTQQRNPDSVTITVTVTNKQGDYVKGLNRSDFTIFEGKSPLEIASLDYGDEPASVGIVYDRSQSMRDAERFSRPKVVREALDHFIQTSNRSSSYFLVTFSDHPQLMVDWTRERETLFRGVEAAPATGNSAFYDACQMALEKLRTGEYRKRVMLLISDGLDTRSRVSYRDLRQLVITSDVLLYAIPANGASEQGTVAWEGRIILDELASITGGGAVYPSSHSEFVAAIQQIAFELSRQYRITFKPDDSSKGGKWRELKIKVTTPLDAPGELQGLKVRSRRGYSIPASL